MFVVFGALGRESSGKLRARCAKLGQDGGNLRPRWATMASRWPSWSQLWRLWGHLVRNLDDFGGVWGRIWEVFWHMAGRVKTLIFLGFFKVFRYSRVLGGLLGHLGDHVRRLWRAWARIFWKNAGKMREVRPRWQQVAPKMGHDGVKMAILVSTLAALGPSCA